MPTNEQRMKNEELKRLNSELEEKFSEDEELKEIFKGGQENEDVRVIFEMMSKDDKKKLLNSGYSTEEIRKFLSNFMNIYEVIISEMDQDIYKTKNTMMLQMLHIQIKGAKEGLYKKMAKEIKDNPDISLKQFYQKSRKEFKTRFKDTFETSEYEEKTLRFQKFVAKMIIASMFLVDLKSEESLK